MLSVERHLKIIEIISELGSAQVDQLAQMLDVSPMTIRRDLEKLKKEGVIERCHGGAIMKQETTYADKSVSRNKEKVAIAKKCAEYVKKEDTIFLDAGTTTYEIARCIKDISGITVITNDLEIAQLLKASEVDLIICGGHVQKTTGSMYGFFANQMMESFRMSIGFFGAASIDNQYNVLTPTLEKTFLKRMVINNCQRSFLAVDASKFNRKALLKINHFKDYTGIVTDKVFTQKEQKEMEEAGIRIISV